MAQGSRNAQVLVVGVGGGFGFAVRRMAGVAGSPARMERPPGADSLEVAVERRRTGVVGVVVGGRSAKRTDGGGPGSVVDTAVATLRTRGGLRSRGEL